MTSRCATAAARVCYATEYLVSPLDEGIKNFAYDLLAAIARSYTVLCCYCKADVLDELAISAIQSDRWFLRSSVRAGIRAFDPDVLIYLPFSSTTTGGFIRSLALKRAAPRAVVGVISIQPRKYGLPARLLASRLHGVTFMPQSRSSAAELAGIGLRTRTIPAGVDIAKFCPPDPGRKSALKDKYGLPANRPVALHVGHIKESRSVRALLAIQESGVAQVVLVGSTSTTQDASLAKELSEAGVVVLAGFVPDISEMYQAADVYVFPVKSATGAIEFPLSVLEAMACNLPVATTKFGGLEEAFNEVSGVIFFDSANDLPSVVAKALACVPETRRAAEAYSWDAVAKAVVDSLLADGGKGGDI